MQTFKFLCILWQCILSILVSETGCIVTGLFPESVGNDVEWTWMKLHCSPIVWNHPTGASAFPCSRWKSMLTSSECAMQFSKDPIPNSFLRSVDFSSYSKSQCVIFISNTFSYVLSLFLNCNFKTKWQSCKPIPHLEFLNSLFSCLVVGCLRGRYRGTQECNKVASPKSSVVFGRPEELSKGHMGIGWSRPHQEKTVPLSESW